MPRHRTQLLLDPDQYQAVVRLAAIQQRPISEIVREFIDLGLDQLHRHRQQKLQALAELNASRRELEARQGMYQGDLVAEVRAEREQQMEAVLSLTGGSES